MSYVHNQRTGAADLLPINGPQVINAVVDQSNPTDPAFRITGDELGDTKGKINSVGMCT